jgi:tRNA-dependent cyclodipeptide synthase
MFFQTLRKHINGIIGIGIEINNEPSNIALDKIHSVISINKFCYTSSKKLIKDYICWTKTNLNDLNIFFYNETPVSDSKIEYNNPETFFRKLSKPKSLLINYIVTSLQNVGYSLKEANSKIITISHLKDNEVYLKARNFYIELFNLNAAFRQKCIDITKQNILIKNYLRPTFNHTLDESVLHLLYELPMFFNSGAVLNKQNSISTSPLDLISTSLKEKICQNNETLPKFFYEFAEMQLDLNNKLNNFLLAPTYVNLAGENFVNVRLVDKIVQEHQKILLQQIKHDIKSPLSAILILTDILKYSINDAKNNTKIIELINNLTEATNSLNTFLNSITKTCGVGHAESANNTFDLKNIIKHIFNVFIPIANSKNIAIEFLDEDTTMPTLLFSNEDKMFRILMELVNNAIKYTKSGKITLGVKAHYGYYDNNWVDIIIADTGPGIPEEVLNRLVSAEEIGLEYQALNVGRGFGISMITTMARSIGLKISAKTGATGTEIKLSTQYNIKNGQLYEDE